MKKSELVSLIKEVYSESTSLLKEDKENEFVTDDRFKTIAQLHSYIETNATKSLNNLLASAGIKAKITIKIEENRRGSNSMRLESKKFTGDDLGIYKFCMKEAKFEIFNGGIIQSKSTETGIEFIPTIWCELNLSYEHIGGGTNGASFYFPGEKRSSIWFDIKSGQFLPLTKAMAAGL